MANLFLTKTHTAPSSSSFLVSCLRMMKLKSWVHLNRFKKPNLWCTYSISLPEKRRVKVSGFLPNDLLFLLVSSLGRTNFDGSYWELIKLFSNGAVFRAGMQDQFLVVVRSMAAVMILSIYFVGDLECDTLECEVSNVRRIFEIHVRYLLHINYPNVLCSVCVSPCEGKNFYETLKLRKYHCPDILGRLGEVGYKRLKTAVCIEHSKSDAVQNYNCWFCNERRQQLVKDQKLFNRISKMIEDLPMLRNIGLALDVEVEDIEGRFSRSKSNSRIEDATFGVLYYDWYKKNERGNIIEGTDAFNQLSNALSEAGLAKTLSQLLHAKWLV